MKLELPSPRHIRCLWCSHPLRRRILSTSSSRFWGFFIRTPRRAGPRRLRVGQGAALIDGIPRLAVSSEGKARPRLYPGDKNLVLQAQPAHILLCGGSPMDHLHDLVGASRWGRGHRGLGFARRCYPVRLLTYLPVDRFPVPIAEYVEEPHLTCLFLINCRFLSLIPYQDVNEVLQEHYGGVKRDVSKKSTGSCPST